MAFLMFLQSLSYQNLLSEFTVIPPTKPSFLRSFSLLSFEFFDIFLTWTQYSNCPLFLFYLRLPVPLSSLCLSLHPLHLNPFVFRSLNRLTHLLHDKILYLFCPSFSLILHHPMVLK